MSADALTFDQIHAGISMEETRGRDPLHRSRLTQGAANNEK